MGRFLVLGVGALLIVLGTACAGPRSTATPTATLTPVRTALPTVTPTQVRTATPISTPRPTATPSPTPTHTRTPTPVPTATPTFSPTSAVVPTTTPTPTPVPTVAPTPTPIITVPQYQRQQVVFERAAFDVELAATAAQRATGLMGREHLGDREGMLFVQEMEGIYSFGMGGMVIPLDILWMDADGVVAGVTANVSPDPEGTTSASYSPPRPVLYVLEIKAGLAESVGISAGSQAKFVPEFD